MRAALRELYGPGIETYGHPIDHGLDAVLGIGFGTTRVAGLLNINEPLYEYDERAFRNALEAKGISVTSASRAQAITPASP